VLLHVSASQNSGITLVDDAFAEQERAVQKHLQRLLRTRPPGRRHPSTRTGHELGRCVRVWIGLFLLFVNILLKPSGHTAVQTRVAVRCSGREDELDERATDAEQFTRTTDKIEPCP
ncbi:hypothetical protein ACFYR1_53280, partial [Streptomyces canus]|uniref:hypothetical protein n=1 Tax=Streptomyces canus TaxID=58343 RepID=UPI0036BA5D68